MRLRVMTYNILVGAAGREEAVLEVVRAVDPDVLFMQEIRDRDNAAYFAEALEMPFRFSQSNSRERNLALLSRHPIVACEAHRPFPLLRSLLLATISLPGGGQLNLCGVHLGLIHDLWRAYEMRAILERIEAYEQGQPSRLSLIAGDFNAVAPGERVVYEGAPLHHRLAFAVEFPRFPRRALLPLQRAGYIDCFRTLHPHADGFTIPTPSPKLRLDYIFANRPLAEHLCTCEVVTAPEIVHEASDHYPLIATFEL